MKVKLFRDMKAERWYSMDRYADCLQEALSKKKELDVSSFSVEPLLESSKATMFWRTLIYPTLAKFRQGEVNHILDHSYAHLLNFLDAKRTVVTCHDLIPLDFENNPSVLDLFNDTVHNLHKAARIIAVSESTKADIVNKLGIDANKVDVVYSGVDSIFHRFDTAELKQKYKEKFGLPEGKIILNFGSNLRYKNVETVLKVFKDILAVIPSAYLLRIHPLSREQRRLAEDLGILPNYLEVLNPIDEDLVGLYNCGDVLLSPSLKEGFGLHVLEALACGTSVVVSKGTSLEEVTGNYGIKVDPLNVLEIVRSVLSVLERPGEIHTEDFLNWARAFTWERTAKKTFEVYQKTLAQLSS